MLDIITKKIIPIETNVSMCIPNIPIPIFIPVNINITATPYLRNANLSCKDSNTKYNCRSPKIANMLDVYTMKRSVLMEKTAGMESVANIISENSIKTMTAKSGVA